MCIFSWYISSLKTSSLLKGSRNGIKKLESLLSKYIHSKIKLINWVQKWRFLSFHAQVVPLIIHNDKKKIEKKIKKKWWNQSFIQSGIPTAQTQNLNKMKIIHQVYMFFSPKTNITETHIRIFRNPRTTRVCWFCFTWVKDILNLCLKIKQINQRTRFTKVTSTYSRAS